MRECIRVYMCNCVCALFMRNRYRLLDFATFLTSVSFLFLFKKKLTNQTIKKKGILLFAKYILALTMVKKMPNSMFKSTMSPSVKTNCFLRSFLQANTMAICCAATDKTGNSMRLNSSKQPQDPDWAKPAQNENQMFLQ